MNFGSMLGVMPSGFSPNKNFLPSDFPPNQNFLFFSPFPNFQARGREQDNGRGIFPFNGNRSICQLCGKQGHLVSGCWYWFEQNS